MNILSSRINDGERLSITVNTDTSTEYRKTITTRIRQTIICVILCHILFVSNQMFTRIVFGILQDGRNITQYTHIRIYTYNVYTVIKTYALVFSTRRFIKMLYYYILYYCEHE